MDRTSNGWRMGDRFGVKARIRERNRYVPDETQKMLAHRPPMYNEAKCVGPNPTMKFPNDIVIDEDGNAEKVK